MQMGRSMNGEQISEIKKKMMENCTDEEDMCK
jgi:hypothetical protein